MYKNECISWDMKVFLFCLQYMCRNNIHWNNWNMYIYIYIELQPYDVWGYVCEDIYIYTNESNGIYHTRSYQPEIVVYYVGFNGGPNQAIICTAGD